MTMMKHSSQTKILKRNVVAPKRVFETSTMMRAVEVGLEGTKINVGHLERTCTILIQTRNHKPNGQLGAEVEVVVDAAPSAVPRKRVWLTILIHPLLLQRTVMYPKAEEVERKTNVVPINR